MSNPKTVQKWLSNHEKDYQAVRKRLEKARAMLLHGSLEAAAKALKRSYVNAVLSIRTDKDRHEPAFVGHFSGNLTLKEAALETVYGGNKKNWLQRTMDKTDWQNVALAVRAHVRVGNYADLLQAVVDNLVGVAHRKASFMLAMLGLTEYMCIDSNVARYAGLEDTEDNSLSFNSARAYLDKCDEIRSNTVGNANLEPFIVQWAIYDCMRGEHSRHMVFFNEIFSL